INAGSILSCHDISEGGLAVALAEICFGSQFGVEIDLSEFNADPYKLLFNETAGCFVLEVDEMNLKQLLNKNQPIKIAGKTSRQQKIIIQNNDQVLLDTDIELLRNYWQQPFKKVFNL